MRRIEEIMKNEYVWGLKHFANGQYRGFVKLPECGSCSIVIGISESGMEHVSVSPIRMRKLPSWDDMCRLKDICWKPDEECYQIHPAESEYVNLMQNCLHIWRPADGRRLGDK